MQLLPSLLLALVQQPAPQPTPSAPSPESPPSTGDVLTLYSAGVEQLFADPRDRGLAKLLADLPGMLVAVEKTQDSPAPDVVKLVARWIAEPVGLRFGLGADTQPSFQLDVRFASQQTALRELGALRDALADDGLELSTSGEEPGTMRAATPVGELVARAQKSGPHGVVTLTLGRTAREPFARPEVSLPRGVEPAFALRFDGGALGGLMAAAEESVDAEDRRSFGVGLALFEDLGLVGERATPMTFAVGHGEVESITTRHVEGWKQSFFGRGAVVLDEDDLRLLPADTLWGWVGSFDATKLVDLARELAPAETTQALAMWKTGVGLDLEGELLGAIGPVLGAYASTSSGGASGPGGLVLFARSEDPAGFVSTVEELLEMLTRTRDLPLRPTHFTHGGTEATAFSLPGTAMPFEPCLAAGDGVVYLALSRGALVEGLEQAQRETSVLDHARLAALPEGALQQLVSFGFTDAPKCLERGYGVVGMLQTSLSSLAQGFGGGGPGAPGLPNLSQLVPSYANLARGARPTVALGYLRGDDLLQATTHDPSWVARGVSMAGSPAGQMNPMALGIVSSIAIPKLMTARLSANESAAVATLRSLASAQAQFQAAAVLDADADGFGEYGFLDELSGGVPLRGSTEPMRPPVLSSAFAALADDGCGGEVVERSGYLFQLWLPTERGAVGTSGAETVATDPAERRWCAYAWPMSFGRTGNRAFFIDESGGLWSCANDERRAYEGTCATGGYQPAFDAALSTQGDLGSTPPDGAGRSVDGNRWTRVQ